ncbi:pentapeptide repeat-containing protein [Actinopolymorpha pittospori]
MRWAGTTEDQRGGADLTGADLSGARLLRTECAETLMVGAVLDHCDLTATVLWRADLRRASVRDARMDASGFAETLVEDTTFVGSTGTVGVGGTVILGKNGKPVEAVAALTTAGARVTEYRPKRRG